jgi:uroporphyrinogen-III synthase
MSEQTMKSLPLQGLRILNTRANEQAGVFSAQLGALGAIPIEFPTIRIVAPEDSAPLDLALKHLCTSDLYDWLVFTSTNGVKSFFERLANQEYSLTSLEKVHIAAIGPATATTLRKFGARVDLIPSNYIAEAVANAIVEYARVRGENLAGKRILLARAAEARNVLIYELQNAGAVVDVVAAYQTLGIGKDGSYQQLIHRQMKAQELDIITFTSSSTIRNFMHWLTDFDESFTEEFLHHVRVSGRPKIACIGPITSQTAREYGLKVQIEAQEYTIPGLIQAIVRNEEKR